MKVAVAVITDVASQVLITQRAQKDTHAGFWEFPGGKLEEGELGPTALCREVKEEVGLDVLVYHYLGEINHTYPQYDVSLMVYHVSHYHGNARCCEAQMDLRWVAFDGLRQYAFPAANRDIITLITPLFERERATAGKLLNPL